MTWAQDKVNSGVDNSHYVLDYSAGKLKGEDIAKAGYSFSKRYIDSRTNLRTKHTDRAEYRDHLVNGQHDTLVMEVDVNDPLGGYQNGVNLARRAVDGAQYIGYQGDRIAFCCDRHFIAVGQPQITAQIWQDFLGGAASVIGLDAVEAYGFSEAIDAAVGHATYFWQAGSISVVRNVTGAWQDNNWRGTVAGIAVDRNLLKTKVEQDMTPEEHEWLRQNNAVLGAAFQGDTGENAGTRLREIDERITRVEAKLEGLSVGAVDYDLLADRVTDRLLAKLNLKQAPSV